MHLISTQKLILVLLDNTLHLFLDSVDIFQDLLVAFLDKLLVILFTIAELYLPFLTGGLRGGCEKSVLVEVGLNFFGYDGGGTFSLIHMDANNFM